MVRHKFWGAVKGTGKDLRNLGEYCFLILTFLLLHPRVCIQLFYPVHIFSLTLNRILY